MTSMPAATPARTRRGREASRGRRIQGSSTHRFVSHARMSAATAQNRPAGGVKGCTQHERRDDDLTASATGTASMKYCPGIARDGRQ